MNENQNERTLCAAQAVQLAARSVLEALASANNPEGWALGDPTYWAARAAAEAARSAGDDETADFTDQLADEFVTLANSVGHTIRR